MNSVLILVSGIVVLLLLEGGLRWGVGLGNPLLYVADPQIGYLLAPKQQTRRFGKRIAINAYSMRSPEISPTRPARTWRVLLLGDSIANGGWWTDQHQTISALIQQQLQASLPEDQRVEVLNASANSWGPRNELAYVQRFGSFESQVIVLLLNTDDLFAAAPSSLKVGRDLNYPDRKPALALIELWHRYWFKLQSRLAQAVSEADAALGSADGDRVGLNLAAIQQLQELAHRHHSHLIVGITSLRREVSAAGSRNYEQQARQRLQDMTNAAAIPLVDFLPIFKALEQPQSLYQDSIHLNGLGNLIVSHYLTQAISSHLSGP
ncbi:MAG: SGNH/GDSL hydrolase family protein [Synechococcales cyanobacterium M58_A2018_015]|nr:SGNH/GDSL hydrolase family protein [Synechococcales cyanobacterium M58_A2018_015]